MKSFWFLIPVISIIILSSESGNCASQQVQDGEMVLIPAGEFLMGSTEKDGRVGYSGGIDELPQHNVYLKSYYIGKKEVTNREYKMFINDTGHTPPSESDQSIYSWAEGA